MRLTGKDIWTLNIYTWAGMSIGAKHWYWDLENTETREIFGRTDSVFDKLLDDLDTGSCLLRGDAILAGTREFLSKTTEGAEGILFIANRNSVIHGIEIHESWQEA